MSKNHVFISYAHVDNEVFGWVSTFHTALEKLLRQKANKHATVWRDPQMERNAIFDKEIFDKLLQSLTLVSVVSPNYIESEYCQKELKEFCENAAPFGNNSRVFKVVKTPVPLKEMPKVFQQINGFDFFKFDDESKTPREFIPEFGKEYEQQFWLKVSDLAYEIAKLLKLMNAAAVKQTSVSAPISLKPIVSKSATIYLARTSSDFQIEHDNIRRDLLERGYQVLPLIDEVEPKTTEEYKQFVRDNLQKCKLSVHLIGKNYGETPEDGEQSYIHLQSVVAAERDQDPNFTRIIWIPKDVNSVQPRHQNFVAGLWSASAETVQVLEKPLEDLKTDILDALNREVKPVSQSKSSTFKPSVLILYDKADAESAVDIENRLKEQGLSVRSLAKYLSSEISVMTEAENDYLRSCDAVLIYWKNTRESWVQSKLAKLQKIFGDGRDEEFLGEAVFVEDGTLIDDLDTETNAEFIGSFDKLDAFLETVKAAFQTKFSKGGQK